ncbi:SCO2322 family protein [Streptomyces sp. NPDC050674]|uniref:SCO2322 family protein n=1 Tax=Streptomyces sp. NPDC050674 TaxID=3157216 RepID=UPI00343C8D00
MIRRGVLLLLALFLLCAGTGPAQAAGYRYWSFWEREGDRWVYATQGPSVARPSDGDVQGFRFAVSEDSADATRPRGTAGFSTICAKTPPRDGRKRVALVIDFGTPSDAPEGETPPAARTACARISPDATTAEALAAVAGPLRYDPNALLCAISGYPERGCGEQVSRRQDRRREPAAGERSPSDGGPSLGLVAGIAVVALLGGAAVWQVRRRG